MDCINGSYKNKINYFLYWFVILTLMMAKDPVSMLIINSEMIYQTTIHLWHALVGHKVSLQTMIKKRVNKTIQLKKDQIKVCTLYHPFSLFCPTLTHSVFLLYCSAPLCCPLANSFILTHLLTALISLIPPSRDQQPVERGRWERERKGKIQPTTFFSLQWKWLFICVCWFDLFKGLIDQWSLFS